MWIWIDIISSSKINNMEKKESLTIAGEIVIRKELVLIDCLDVLEVWLLMIWEFPFNIYEQLNKRQTFGEHILSMFLINYRK